MNEIMAKLSTALSGIESDFIGFLNELFALRNLKSASNKALQNLENLNEFDFTKSEIYATNADWEVDLEKAEETGHKNLAFTIISCKTHKKADLVKATKAVNRAIPSYNIIFFVGKDSRDFTANLKLSIAFASRRFHARSKIDKDVIDKITLIKDINLHAPSTAHLLNLKAILDIKPSAVNLYYAAILEALSVSALNKRFYKDIFEHFAEFIKALQLPNLNDESTKRSFILRLICRILFCKFLEKKGILSAKIWDVNLSGQSGEYYHEILEPLFFTTLNTPKNDRDYALLNDEIQGILGEIPYLNGGLFSPQKDDFYHAQNAIKYSTSSLKVPNFCFEKLFKTLDNYHFTIDEASSDAQEVALDPELLGQIFESLLSELFTDNKLENLDKSSLRKATGSYYTPREIVRYMVKSSLESYLKNAILQSASLRGENLAQKLHDLIFNHKFSDEILALKNEILHALNSLKILDPACGSGAFPMGILHEMLEIYLMLDPNGENLSENFAQNSSISYLYKLKILQNSIYGVDLQPMATELSRLRCFLSLIIDEDAAHIKPLPNLEFKFVSANTLLPLSKHDSLNYHGFEADMQDLQKLRNDFFTAHDKHDLQIKYLEKRNQIAKNTSLTDIANNTKMPLLDYNPFDTQSVANFFDSEWIFGVKEFDIVIGNPPYGAKLSDTDKKTFKSTYKYAISGNLDTYKLFIERGFNLLRKGGNLSFIVPMSVTASESMVALHKMLLENCENISISSYGYRPNQIFPNAATNVSIISFTKTLSPTQKLLTTTINKRYKDKSVGQIIENLAFVNSLDLIKTGRIPKISKEIEAEILHKIYAVKTTIADLLSDKQDAEFVYYRKAGGLYYKLATTFATNSVAEAVLGLMPKYAKLVGAIMNSSLFYWFWLINSDWLNMRSYEIMDFAVPIENFSDDNIKQVREIYAEYEKDLIKNAKPYRSKGELAYYARLSKHLIDKIDDLICPLYGLSAEETDFIKNYEIEFRTDSEKE